MDYIDIRFALAKKGYTLAKLARELELSGVTPVARVLKRDYISSRVEERVSEITQIPLAKLFPDRYGKKRVRKSKKPTGGSRGGIQQ